MIIYAAIRQNKFQQKNSEKKCILHKKRKDKKVSILIYVVLAVIVLAICYITFNFFHVKAMKEGTKEMAEMAGIIRSGASAFMITEYKTIAIVVAAVALLFSLFVEKSAGLTFIIGAVMSSTVCVLGMRSATYANVRTANKARESLSIGETVKVALCGGSISGLAVQACGMLGLVLILMFFPINQDTIHELGGGFLTQLDGITPCIMRVTTYSLGCSVVAMFNRVAGGNYTKAADISSDILAKIRHDLPEDDSRVPNVVADFIGDNVNDIAGNCSDLLESFVATMAAAVMIAVMLFKKGEFDAALFTPTTLFPIVLAGGGLLSCLIGLGFAAIKKMGDNPSKELNIATWLSAGVTIVIGLVASWYFFKQQGTVLPDGWMIGWLSPWVSTVLGIGSGVAIGMITEYYTSTDYKPTRKLAEIAEEGEAFVVTKGDAIGSRSCLFPILLIAVALIVSGFLCGIYGVALAALGMLAFVGATVSIDAFGPIADNAGGLAESCHLDAKVRVITDKLDSVGNTTAAIGKGFAIGSAAFATVSLIVAYVSAYSDELSLNFASFWVIAGGIVGGALIEYFSALLTDNTIDAAKVMADDGDKLLSIPGVLEGTVKPDYNKMISTATKLALRKMLVPSVLALLIPVAGGILFGVEFVGGLLVGATICAIPRAIFMGNSGGAFDNAKKYIESGAIQGHGKGTAAHKAAVTGDTIGDTRKDVVGVALDIFIKSMSTVANTLVSVFNSIHLINFK